MKKNGFTLVEVVIALLLVVVVLAGAYLLIVHAARLTRMARDHYIAINIAKNRLERARNFQYSDLYLLQESNMIVDENGAPGENGRFNRSTEVITNYAPNLTQINVTVRIRSRRNNQFGTEQERISTLFTRYLEPSSP